MHWCGSWENGKAVAPTFPKDGSRDSLKTDGETAGVGHRFIPLSPMSIKGD